jgi:hypothetical protein
MILSAKAFVLRFKSSEFIGHLLNPQPAIRNPQSAIRNPQSAIRNPQS